MNDTITAPAAVSTSTVEVPLPTASTAAVDTGADTRTGAPADAERGTTAERGADGTGLAATDGALGAASTAQAGAPTAEAEKLDPRAANSFAIASFVLGLVSIVAGWSFFAPITGLVLGIIALRRGTGERTLALWGIWLNGTLIALFAIAAALFIGLMGIGMIAAI